MLCPKNRISSREVETFVSVLFGRGLVSRCSTSEKGFESLEPYKTKCAIFIAAGFGSRLSPVTLLIAEPLVKVHGVRIIDTLIDSAIATGIEEIYVVCGYPGEHFEHLKEKYPNLNLVTNSMYTESNNVSSVFLVCDKVRNAYISEANPSLHKQVFDKYVFHSCYLGIPTEEPDDWYSKTNSQGCIC